MNPPVEIVVISQEASALCRKITADLPEYFGIPEANEHYAIGVLSRVNFAAKIGNDVVGLISIDFPYPHNANIYWMGILKRYHRQGVGKMLLSQALEYASTHGAATITVETLAPAECDENYLKTYQFYYNNGFQPLFNLKPSGYEWNMVYMCRPNLATHLSLNHNLNIRDFHETDIDLLVSSFARHQWDKPKATFEAYFQEQQAGQRQVWLALVKDELAGYVTLNWQSSYGPFAAQKIPEIMDLNVLPPFRKLGIGTALIDRAEQYAAKISPLIGIGVGLYDGYGDAQKLYVQRGYIPDGSGPTYQYVKLDYSQSVLVDDDLVMWFTKRVGS